MSSVKGYGIDIEIHSAVGGFVGHFQYIRELVGGVVMSDPEPTESICKFFNASCNARVSRISL